MLSQEETLLFVKKLNVVLKTLSSILDEYCEVVESEVGKFCIKEDDNIIGENSGKLFNVDDYHPEVEGFPFYSRVVSGYGDEGIVLPISREYNLSEYKVGIVMLPTNRRTIEINDVWYSYTNKGEYVRNQVNQNDIKIIPYIKK